METKALQVYLTAEQYSVLREAAVKYGRPMTDIVRELIQVHLVPEGPAPCDLSELAGVVSVGRPTNVAEERDSMLAAALDDLRRH